MGASSPRKRWRQLLWRLGPQLNLSPRTWGLSAQLNSRTWGLSPQLNLSQLWRSKHLWLSPRVNQAQKQTFKRLCTWPWVLAAQYMLGLSPLMQGPAPAGADVTVLTVVMGSGPGTPYRLH